MPRNEQHTERDVMPGRGRATSRGRENADSFTIYLNDIRKYPLLTRADEVQLAGDIARGRKAEVALKRRGGLSDDEKRKAEVQVEAGRKAKEMFVGSNLKLVVNIAKRYTGNGLPIMDLIQEGTFGLMHAVDKFDARKGFKFSTYATSWIRQAVIKGIRDTGRNIRIPTHRHEEHRAIKNVSTAFLIDNGREPTTDELAAKLKRTPDEVTNIAKIFQQERALEDHVSSDSDSPTIGDRVAETTAPRPDVAGLSSTEIKEIGEILDLLPERERRAVVLSYGFDRGYPRSNVEVGAVLEISRELARQTVENAINRLNSYFNPDSQTQDGQPKSTAREEKKFETFAALSGEELIVLLREDGLSPSDIALKYSISRRVVAQKMKIEGIKPHTASESARRRDQNGHTRTLAKVDSMV